METRSRLSLAVVLGTSLCSSAHAQEGTVKKDPMQGRFTVDVNDPEANLPAPEDANKYPLDWGYMLMELDERAQAAADRGDWKAAIKFHRAAAKLTPDRAISYALLCTDYEKAGRRADAVEACFQALNHDGAKLDYFARYVRLVADRPGGTEPVEVENALKAIGHLKGDETGELTAYELQCELSLRTGDESALSECSRELVQRTPHSPRAIGYAWALAVQRKEFAKARKLIRDARRDGARPAAIAKMEDATRAAERGDSGGAVVGASSAEHTPPPSGPTSEPARQPAAVEGSEPAAPSAPSVSSAVQSSLHPMLRWLLGLLAALAIAIPVARRFVAPRRGA